MTSPTMNNFIHYAEFERRPLVQDELYAPAANSGAIQLSMPAYPDSTGRGGQEVG